MTPPLGLITVAALCPSSWSLRLLDRAFDEIRDEDYRWADLVMVSSMHAQRVDTLAILARARSLGKRTFIGGPWASSEPERLTDFADHVLVGEAEEVFAAIADDLENIVTRIRVILAAAIEGEPLRAFPAECLGVYAPL